MTALPPRPVAAQRLGRLLRPRSLAVFGGSAAAEVIRQADKIGFSGDIWPVHPGKNEIGGRRAFRCAKDLPEAPDAAFIGVNRYASIDIMAELAACGTGGAVAFASGFSEAGAEGQALQARLLQAAGAMPFFGPNCYGFLNYLDRTLTWPDQHGGAPVPRGVAIITQSGNIGLNVTMQRRALPIAMLITLGNQASLAHADAMDAVLDDPRITAIGLHMEAIGDPDALASAVARARARNVPVVALKTGRSAEGARIAQSHTAALASGDAVVDAFFRRIGVARVESIPALLETLKILHYLGPLPGRTISSLSCSGGEAALIADTAASCGLRFAKLDARATARIAATLPDLVSISNPLDYHTFGWRNRPALAATFGAMMRAGADLNLLILDFPRPDKCETQDWDIAASAMGDAAAAEKRPAAVLATLPDAMPEDHANALAASGLVPLFGMNEALQAIAAAAEAGCSPVAGASAPRAAGVAISGVPVSFSEFDGKRALASCGVPVPDGAIAVSAAQAAAEAARLGFPVVVKATGAALAHKSELGGVRLNLHNENDVAAAAEALLALSGQVLVERMVTAAAAELIVGVARDAVLGLHLLLGAGGVLAELLDDTATLLLPASRAEITAALLGLRAAPLLHGYRGAPPADIEAAISVICAIQDFVQAHATRLIELDVNPLIVRAAGQGAVAADVLLRMAREEAHV
jgi:acyl-CoA synthetase (NDP forming)